MKKTSTEHVRAWRAKNPEKQSAWQRTYQAKNAERLREKNRDYKKANYQRELERVRDWRKKNPDKIRANRQTPARREDALRRSRERSADLTERMRQLKDKPCADCGGRFPACCMDFDHRPGERKVAKVSNLVKFTWNVVLAEIAKCDLVCANCHRIRTWTRARDLRRPRPRPPQMELRL